MTTLIFLIYILALVITYVAYQKVLEYKNETFAKYFVSFSWLAALFIAIGLAADLYPIGDKRLMYFVIFGGTVPLGLLSLESFLMPVFFGDSIEMPELGLNESLLHIVIEVIGLIASILGIISFFQNR